MTFRTLLLNSDPKDLVRVYNSNKAYLFIDVSVFNSGQIIKLICTDTPRTINYGNWNGYDQLHENDYLVKHFITEVLRDIIKEDVSRFKKESTYKKAFNIINSEL